MEIKIELAATRKPKPDPETLGFGNYFSDHMFVMDYDVGEGWHDPRIVPYGPFLIEPSAKVFHYGQEAFEGMKAYLLPDGGISLFRPWENFKRLNNTNERLSIPKIDEEFALEALIKLIEVDRDWVPSFPGTSLYIRPVIIGTEPRLGVHASDSYKFFMLLSPAGSYYKEGLDPVSIVVEDEDVRAVRGGTGYAKTGGNYAASLRADEKAHKMGYSQVLWLDGVHRKYIEEAGAMNVLFKINGEVITPMLAGSILPGITRKSCLEMLRSWGVPVTERLISIDELIEELEKGTVEEIFSSGTAAVVSPIGEILYKGKKYSINEGKIGPLTQKLYDELTGLQRGEKPDPFGWTLKIL